MRKYKLKFPFRLAVTVIIIFGLAIFCVGMIRKILTQSEYFKVKDIISASGNSADLSYLKGRNIFKVKLQDEARDISRIYPGYKKVTLVRVLPNRIFINFLKRNAVALVKSYQYFCVDNESVIFDMPQNLTTNDLPVISGLESKMPQPAAGRKYALKELTLALNLIKMVTQNRALKDYKLKKIDAANINNASFFIEPMNQLKTKPKILEIKFSSSDLDEKINLLTTLLTPVKDEWDNIKYIDLRFKEPLISFRDVK